MELPTLDGLVHRSVVTAIKDLHQTLESVKTAHVNLASSVKALPDPRGPLTADQTTQVQQALSASNQLVQQVGGFPMIANIPTTDPKVAGVLWNDTGTVKVSAG